MADNLPLLSPQDAARSLPHFTGGSQDACIDDAINFLSKLGYDPVTMTLKHDVTSDGAHQQLRRKRETLQKIYCRRCTAYNMNSWRTFGQTFQCCVIATFNVHPEGSGYSLYLRSLFPHAKECRKYDIDKHMRSIIRGHNYGSGFLKFNIDFQTVIGNVFDPILEKLQRLSKADLGLHNSQLGKKITSGFSDGNTPELRWHILLQSELQDETQRQINGHYGLNSPEFNDALNKLMTRISIVVANELNIAQELNFEKFESPCNRHPPHSHLHPHTTQNHLWIRNPSIIFGGYNGPTTQKTVHQIPHTDYAAVSGVDLSESDQFQHDWKPSSIIVPLVDWRNIVIYKDVNGKMSEHIKTVKRGEMFVFEGDVVHGGESYDASNDMNPPLHPALHLYLYSKKHPSDLNTFTISTHHCLRQDQFTPFLHKIITPESAMEELETSLMGTARLVEKIRLIGNMDECKLEDRVKKITSKVNGMFEDVVRDSKQVYNDAEEARLDLNVKVKREAPWDEDTDTEDARLDLNVKREAPWDEDTDTEDARLGLNVKVKREAPWDEDTDTEDAVPMKRRG